MRTGAEGPQDRVQRPAVVNTALNLQVATTVGTVLQGDDKPNGRRARGSFSTASSSAAEGMKLLCRGAMTGEPYSALVRLRM
jgi:hypothetical protein